MCTRRHAPDLLTCYSRAMSKNIVARISLFIVFAGFGLLKILGKSPASPLVLALLEKTLPFITPQLFLIGFGTFEILIGVLFLLRKFRKLTIVLFAIHMITTFLPLILLPDITWQDTFIPTLEGQYILKNLVLIALVLYL
jgi:hypothetical protein